MSNQFEQYAPPKGRTHDAVLMQQVNVFKNEMLATEMLNAVPDIFLVLNSDRQIIYANDTLPELLGQATSDSLIGMRPGEALSCVHAATSTDGCGTTEFCAECGAAKAIVSTLRGKIDTQECRISLVNGDSLDLRVTTKPLRIAGELFVMFALQDISHEKRREVMEYLFFHDIINTAGVITGVMDLMEMYEEDGEQLDLNQFRDELNSASHRIVDEVKAQRQIIAAESDALALDMKTVDVESFLNQLIKTIQRNKAVEDVKIVLESGLNVALYTDETLLGRVLINMIKNAGEASDVGECVTVSYALDDNNIVFKVHNNSYMPHNVQLQVFKRSFSTKGTGRGLGTYSIKLLTEQYLDGRVWFESSKTGGTTFFAAYPVPLAAATDQATEIQQTVS